MSRRKTMLLLVRKVGQTLVIDGNIRVTVLSVKGNTIRLGIESPNVERKELRLKQKSAA
jgi:carbon storage regulator